MFCTIIRKSAISANYGIPGIFEVLVWVVGTEKQTKLFRNLNCFQQQLNNGKITFV